ncbi:MAG TPA: alpha/beta fold hydrolase [Candidatus Competibacteraceae bacterium]|nr:alpha/beta fold hydrolase [Candidatus Competibacteraceae bacterium]
MIELAPWYAQTDRLRRLAGCCLDALGWGPEETPSQPVFAEPCLTLRRYDDGPAGKPAVLLIPAPIKAAYIWDLLPAVSAVRRCREGGLRVYLMQWRAPGEGERGFGLADYADRLVGDALDAIRAETGQASVVLIGHSLGGTCAALFAALHPERVRGLVLLASPLHFGPETGLFGPAVAELPNARTLTVQLGNVPGSVINGLCLLASPATFDWSRRWDWWCSLLSPAALRTHLLVERWTLDEMPLAQRLFEELVELLYREDRFMRGTLRIGGRAATPQQVRAPLLSVVDRHCQIVPPQAVLPFHRAVGGGHLLWYAGDVGVSLQHVGMLVGESAHRHLWPRIVRWVQGHAG